MTTYFDAAKLPKPTNEYVAWIDVMGTQSVMSRSLPIAANFIFKLHAAALKAQTEHAHLYPVMDGFYVSSPDQKVILDFLRAVFSEVAETIVAEKSNWHRYIVRGALAFGPITHGSDVPKSASASFGTDLGVQYKRSLLLGMPVVQSYLGEKNAPPLGLFVHESARAFAPKGAEPLHDVWWRWCNTNTQATWKKLPKALDDYFEWCRNHARSILYDINKIDAHAELVRQYFAD
jgi:hypothetical protein